jgi:hypothetical protein
MMIVLWKNFWRLLVDGWMFLRGGAEMVSERESQAIILTAFSPHIHRYTHSE